ncbi:hypothetical protein GCM10022217_24070 [Chryseobacterium ginsenosidimutans]
MVKDNKYIIVIAIADNYGQSHLRISDNKRNMNLQTDISFDMKFTAINIFNWCIKAIYKALLQN